jgi:nitrogen fixation protein NifU and related proteins
MSDLDDLYREVILDHSRRPIGRGGVEGATASHHEYNPTCGDEVTVGIWLGEHGELADVRWDGQGCSISTASASVMSDLVRGLAREDAQALVDEFRRLVRGGGEVEASEALGDAAAFAGVAKLVTRVKCAMLPWVALEADLKTSA